MPSSVVQTFADPDEFAASIRAGSVELTVTGRGRFGAKLTRIDLHRLWMQRFADNLPRIADVALVPERAFLAFVSPPGPPQRWSGKELHPSSLIRLSGPDSLFHQTRGAARYAAMSLPIEDMASAEAMAGCDLTSARDATVVTPPNSAMARLQRLHAVAAHLAEAAPENIANPDAARGLEQSLIEAMAECLGHRRGEEKTAAQGQHAIVMRRFRRVLEENSEQPIYVSEICQAIRVPERTLRVCCQEHLGLSPKRYLMLRRMNLARRALRGAAGDRATVTDIATRFGFWQLGRFAVEYRVLFAETPSATLRRAIGRPAVETPSAEIA